MDAESRMQVMKGIRELVEAGRTVVLATHDRELADECDTCVALP
jgi:ABC-type lipoprotein export system ATPase subunit